MSDVPVGPEVTDDPVQAARALRAGRLVAFPTETVYGLGALARRPEAVARIFAVKGRPPDHPLIVHLAAADDLGRWASTVPPVAAALAEALWPGPLTLLVPRGEAVPDVVTGGRPTVGLRVPDHPVALAVLAAVGDGVAAPSANRYGRVSPTTAAHVVADLGADVDLVLDGGACAVGVESTIVDCTQDVPVVLRPGGVTLDQLAAVLGHPVATWAGDGAPRAPGMHAAHYAPTARLVVVDATDDVAAAVAALGPESVGVLAPVAVPGLGDDVVELEPVGPPERFAHLLYDRLRQADRLGLDALVVVAPPPVGVGAAVVDRLARAARGSGPPPTG